MVPFYSVGLRLLKSLISIEIYGLIGILKTDNIEETWNVTNKRKKDKKKEKRYKVGYHLPLVPFKR